MKRAYERLLVKPRGSARPQCTGNASLMEGSSKPPAKIEWSQPDPRVLQMSEMEK